MRALFIAILIALLPVRGWVGDAMAIGMAGQAAGSMTAALSAASAAATDPASMDHSGMDHSGMDHMDMDHGGMDHGALHAGAAGTDGHDPHGDHPAGNAHAHSACDVCNGPVIAPLGVQIVPDHAPQARLADAGERFISSLPRTGFKPPIS